MSVVHIDWNRMVKGVAEASFKPLEPNLIEMYFFGTFKSPIYRLDESFL